MSAHSNPPLLEPTSGVVRQEPKVHVTESLETEFSQQFEDSDDDGEPSECFLECMGEQLWYYAVRYTSKSNNREIHLSHLQQYQPDLTEFLDDLYVKPSTLFRRGRSLGRSTFDSLVKCYSKRKTTLRVFAIVMIQYLGEELAKDTARAHFKRREKEELCKYGADLLEYFKEYVAKN